jgi:hypothetical protein
VRNRVCAQALTILELIKLDVCHNQITKMHAITRFTGNSEQLMRIHRD